MTHTRSSECILHFHIFESKLFLIIAVIVLFKLKTLKISVLKDIRLKLEIILKWTKRWTIAIRLQEQIGMEKDEGKLVKD